MKAVSINYKMRGFSTLELLIALSLLVVIMTGAVTAIGSAQYWFLTAQVTQEALSKNKSLIANAQSSSTIHFQSVRSAAAEVSRDISIPSDQSCLAGGLCYVTETTVTDISSCAKDISVTVSWKLGLRYPTSTVTARSFISNLKEIIARGGDCLVSSKANNWGSSGSVLGSTATFAQQGITGTDVLGKYMYITSSEAPYLRIYKIFASPHSLPTLVGSSSASNVRLNDIEVTHDYKTSRNYAYVTKHSTTSQLAVYDVTDPVNPELLTELPLFGVDSGGSFPQGWRVFTYSNQLFVVSRETTGPELHIFSIINHRLPVEMTSGVINLNRTVNDMVVRDEFVAGVSRRFLYLAASSDLKEVGVYDVTGSVPIEVAAVNLSGNADAMSLHLSGTTLYVGRKSSTASELYAFDTNKLIVGEVGLLASSEVGAEVLSLLGSGPVLFLGTSKSGEEFQIWKSDVASFNSTVVNAGRLSVKSNSRLAPLGIDFGLNNLYLVSTSLTQPETISVLYTP